MLKPMMRSGWPLNSCDTLLMTPGVSILEIIKIIVEKDAVTKEAKRSLNSGRSCKLLRVKFY